MRLVRLVLNLILVSEIFSFLIHSIQNRDSRNSPIKEPVFQVKMLCQEEGKALIFKAVVSGFGKILCVILSLCLLMEEPLIGSDVSFLYILT